MPNPSPIVGLDTLANLKAAVLPAGLASSTTYDQQLTAIGLAVATAFDAFTGRTLSRTVGATWEGTADRVSVSLPCYPVEQVSQILLRFYGQTDSGAFNGNPVWNDYTAAIVGTLDQSYGLLDLQYPQGTTLDRLQIVYTGGYWIDPQDGETTLPEGATPMPADLVNAWTLQVATELAARDTLGVGAVRDEKQSSPTGFAAGLRLVPAVLAVLNTYRRMAIY